MDAEVDRIARVTAGVTGRSLVPTPAAPSGVHVRCVVCGLIAPYTFDPPFCEDCQEQPFSNPASRKAVEALVDLPTPAGELIIGAVLPDDLDNLTERQKKRYRGLVCTIVTIMVRVTGRVLEAAPDGTPTTIAPERFTAMALREQVFFPGESLYLELRWHHGLGRQLLDTINEDPDQPEHTQRLCRLGMGFLEVARTAYRDGRPVGSGYFAGAAEFRAAVTTVIAHEHAAGRPHGQKEVAAILNRQFRDQGRRGFSGGDQQIRKWVTKYGPAGGWPQLQREGEARAAEFRGY
jgi:hypothetical protein